MDARDPPQPDDPLPASDAILARIEREAGVAGLAEILAERLAPTDLQSLLLEVARRRALRRTPAELLRHYERDRFVRPAAVAPAALLAWERHLHEALPPAVEVLALSPVTPLGSCSALAPVEPRWTLATVRNTEVVADPTTTLALEAALRRRRAKRRRGASARRSAGEATGEATGETTGEVELAAGQRLLRAQPPTGPRQTPHFALFGRVSAGRARGALRFECDALRRHLLGYLAALRGYAPKLPPLRLRCTAVGDARPAHLDELLLAPLREALPALRVEHTARPAHPYYRDVRLQLDAAHEGEWLNLADAGAVDWTQRLLSDAKERLVISGIGSERICTLFGPDAPAPRGAPPRGGATN